VFGFSFVGMPDLMKSVFFHIDKTTGGRGDNGKSFFFSILNELMPNYVYKSKSTFLDKNNSKNHKQISHIKGKRLVFLEEMPKTQAMNHSLFKEIGDGTSIENEVMYGTCEKIKIQCVLHALSNHIPELNAEEEACYNRYRQISYNSHFDRTKTRVEENFDKLEFIADESLKETIINEYADEVFNLIIDYAHLFFERGKKLPPIPKQFQKDTKETQEANDRFGNWFVDNLEEAEGERIPIEKIEEQSKLDRKQITTGMQRRGFIYNKDLRGLGKDVCGKHYKGGFAGVRFIPKYDDES
jgi:phage/plasmid-associated DNA primase